MKRRTKITLEIAINAVIWVAWILIMNSGSSNGIGYFQQPRHDLLVPLIHGAVFNALTFVLNGFWLIPRYLRQRRFGAYFIGVAALFVGIMVFKTLGERLIILASMPDLRELSLVQLGRENLYVFLAMIVLSLCYRFARDWLKGTVADGDSDNGEEQQRAQEIWIKSGSIRERVALDDILYVKACDNYVSFEMPERHLMALMTMQRVMQELPKDRFLRIHRSYIVSLDRVQSVSTDAVIVADNTLPIGRTYRKQARQRLATPT